MRAQARYSKNLNIIMAAAFQTVSVGKVVDIVEFYMHNLTLSCKGTPVVTDQLLSGLCE